MCPEETEQINHNEETAVAVQAVIKQLAKRCRCARPSRLFTVDSIQRVGHKNIYAHDKKNPFRNRIIFNLSWICCLKAIVVKGYQEIVEYGEHKAGKGEKIRCDPQWEKLQSVMIYCEFESATTQKGDKGTVDLP